MKPKKSNFSNFEVSISCLLNMNPDNQKMWSGQESECLPSTSQSYPESEFVPSNPTYPESFHCSQGSTSICIESSKQQNAKSRSFSHLQDYTQVNSEQMILPQPKVKSLGIESQKQNSECRSHGNRNFSDFGASNQQCSVESPRTLNFSELQHIEMRHPAENMGNIIPQTSEWRSSYQDHQQELGMQLNEALHVLIGELSPERFNWRENIHFRSSEDNEISNSQTILQERHGNDHLYPENQNADNSVFSNQNFGYEEPFNQQFLPEYSIEHSTQQQNGNQQISDDLYKTLNVQADMTGTAVPRQSVQIPTIYGIQDNLLSTTHADKNLFQSLGKNSLFANRSVNISPFSKDYLKNYPLFFNRQCLQRNGPLQPSQVYYGPEMSFVDDPETFKDHTCPSKLADLRLSESIQSSGNRHFNQQSWTYAGGQSVSDLPNTGSSYMQMNPHQPQETASNIFKNRTFGFNNDIHWKESRFSCESNTLFLSRGHLAQEIVTTDTTSDEQIRHKFNIFPSCATTSGELVHVTSPVSIHHKNSETCSKTLLLESNIIPNSSQKLENLSNSYAFTNVNLYENVTSFTKDANIPQGLWNSYKNNSFFPGNLNFYKNSQSDSLNQQLYAYSRYKSSFPTEQSINIHPQMNIKEKVFQGEKCAKRKDHLVQHIQTQTNERPYLCPFCPKSFKSKDNLKNHIRYHKNESQYKCDICPKRFSQKGDLKKHLTTHSNERPYPCPFCPKNFKLKDCLRIHILCHKNERQYKCDICPKRFNRKDNLKEHILTHTNERPYPCNFCPKTFTRRSYLDRHIPIHENKSTYLCNGGWGVVNGVSEKERTSKATCKLTKMGGQIFEFFAF